MTHPDPWDVPAAWLASWRTADVSGWDVPGVADFGGPDASAWAVPADVLAAWDEPLPEWPAVPGWDDAPVTDGDGLGDVSANMPSRTQLDGGTDDTPGGPAPDAVTPR